MKISPFFIKRYPTLARMIQYYIPLLKDNLQVKEAWIKTIGFGNYEEGEKAFDEMVTYGTGPWVTPTRPSKEQRDGLMQSLNSFFEPGDAGEWSKYYPNNLSINHFDLDDLEAAIKRGNQNEIGQQMLVVSFVIMHESAHFGKWKHNCCESGDYIYEMGATFEFNAFGKRFSYQNSMIASLDAQAFNRNDVKKYYNQERGKYGSPTFGLTINFYNDIFHFWKHSMQWKLKAGQQGDPTLIDNKDEEPNTSKK